MLVESSLTWQPNWLRWTAFEALARESINLMTLKARVVCRQ